jgi:hypothetical protein
VKNWSRSSFGPLYRIKKFLGRTPSRFLGSKKSPDNNLMNFPDGKTPWEDSQGDFRLGNSAGRTPKGSARLAGQFGEFPTGFPDWNIAWENSLTDFPVWKIRWEDSQGHFRSGKLLGRTLGEFSSLENSSNLSRSHSSPGPYAKFPGSSLFSDVLQTGVTGFPREHCLQIDCIRRFRPSFYFRIAYHVLIVGHA